MSFGINGPENLPAIQKAQNMMNDGGGGNLGYFQREKKKKDENEKEKVDVVELSTKKDNPENDDDLLLEDLESLGTKIKNIWFKIKNNKKSETEKENFFIVNEENKENEKNPR